MTREECARKWGWKYKGRVMFNMQAECLSDLDSLLCPDESAKEMLKPFCERDDAEDFLQTKDIWNHPRISDRTDKESYEVADLMAEFAQKFATLHAQKIADKMVSERLREELIEFLKWNLDGTYGGMTDEMIIDEYLKSRDSHEQHR